jgi:hypothetical protein
MPESFPVLVSFRVKFLKLSSLHFLGCANDTIAHSLISTPWNNCLPFITQTPEKHQKDKGVCGGKADRDVPETVLPDTRRYNKAGSSVAFRL